MSVVTITAVGAIGVAGPISSPGREALLRGDFPVLPGEMISILVGQRGADAPEPAGSGGGGGSYNGGTNPLNLIREGVADGRVEITFEPLLTRGVPF